MVAAISLEVLAAALTAILMVRVMREAGIKEGLPADAVVCMTTATIEGTEALMKQGAKSVRACSTHAVLSGNAVQRIEQSGLEEVVVTNSIPLREDALNCKRIKQLSVGPLLAKAIESVHEDGSVSTLFV